MKNVLITGAGGFIGSHLVELLVHEGYNVKAFLHYNSMNKWGWLEESNTKTEVDIISGDIRDYDSVSSAMKNVDTVFHLAALIGIPYSYVSPLAYIQTNIGGTYNVLQSGKEKDLENILITSTSETYGSAQYVPIDENHPNVGQSPYSATKIGADELALSYYRSFNLPIKIVRPFNTYGPRQSARAIIPTVITQLLSGKKEIKLGNLTPKRDLTFVKDTVRGFYEIAKSGSLFGDVTNIGMQEEISVSELCKLIGEIMECDVSTSTNADRVRPEKSEVSRLLCDNSKLLAQTDWKPEFNLESGLAETIDWFKHNIINYKQDIYNV